MHQYVHSNSGSISAVEYLETFTPSFYFSAFSRDFLNVCVLIHNGGKSYS